MTTAYSVVVLPVDLPASRATHDLGALPRDEALATLARLYHLKDPHAFHTTPGARGRTHLVNITTRRTLCGKNAGADDTLIGPLSCAACTRAVMKRIQAKLAPKDPLLKQARERKKQRRRARRFTSPRT